MLLTILRQEWLSVEATERDIWRLLFLKHTIMSLLFDKINKQVIFIKLLVLFIKEIPKYLLGLPL